MPVVDRDIRAVEHALAQQLGATLAEGVGHVARLHPELGSERVDVRQNMAVEHAGAAADMLDLEPSSFSISSRRGSYPSSE